MTQTRYALITGASSGIGKATALAFAEAGIHLVLMGRNLAKLEAVAAIARQSGVEVQVYSLDFADLAGIQPQVNTIASSVPRLDIVVNNAGMGYTGLLAETSLKDWQQVIDLNLTSVFQCIQGVLPVLRSQRSGTIINVASVAAHQTFPNWGAYCVSKFGLLALSKTLAAEERTHGIRVVTISPGSVNTELWDTETVEADFDRTAMLTPEVVAQSILHMAQMPSTAVVEELVLMPNAGTF
ncbi:SDR family oxidoreductase [Alkalinema sp. FACHB-956]|uniref:SDR family oxidoreductase n=1 Tax=Alkalinema sp. FACHB-956 TaxID=2692768 RepID=UPI001685EFE0|nr:SDR family oxidoreductase [Alkalinema sp. FACHB-956]MBD2327674.1 SDR family oxidoreductase [Alkalinema sp. FACHB-956]